jgi:putative transcriptional regulator
MKRIRRVLPTEQRDRIGHKAGARTVVFDFAQSWRWGLFGATLVGWLGSAPAPLRTGRPDRIPYAATAAAVELADVSLLAQRGLRRIPAPAQRSRAGSLARGKLLVASGELRDPNFAETVVLLIEHGEEGAMGVVINRATRVKLSELLPKIEGLGQRGDIIYEGGPVERSEILMLLRSEQKPEDSRVVFRDVYLSASAALLKRLAAEPAREKAPFRVYSGYAGWASGQLEAEVEAGAWHIFPATETAVFASRPADLWRELHDRTTLRLAGWGTAYRTTAAARLDHPQWRRWGF